MTTPVYPAYRGRTLRAMQGPDERWSLGLASHAPSFGRRSRVLCIIDAFSRECLTAVVDPAISGLRVARELDRIAGT